MAFRSRARVRAIMIAALAACTGPLATNAQAQAYPNRPITVVSPYAAGGDSDLSGRNLANVAPKYLNGQPLIITNVAGASGVIGSQKVRSSAPDGYTLLIARIGSQAILPALDSKMAYKWNDFTFLSLLELNPYVCVVNANSAARNMKDLIAMLKANPGKLNYSSAGAGTIQHMGPQYVFNVAGLPAGAAEHVGYKGAGEATAALLGGQVQFMCTNMTTLGGHLKAGTIRALMTTTAERLKDLPDTPTARELGWPQLEALTGWSGLYGPPGLPADVVAKWTEAFKQIAQDKDWLAGNVAIGGIPAVRSPADTEKFAHEQYELYEKLGTTLGLRK
ncbi:MAG: tripartite tricarboxylate transporter substrate binding protein [Betaproteobacteria bacterium]|nr:tripartite tricarboxylate transporter substrate binding protein [Betaproteobacteria bacterium]